jgi:hypothetical protein
MKNGNVKNIFDQTQRGTYEDDAKEIKSRDFSAKPQKKFVKRYQYLNETGKRGYVPYFATQQFLPSDTHQSKAKVTDFAIIKVAGRR